MSQIREKIREIFDPPHPALLEAGAGGERLVARTRLGFWIFIGLAPLGSLIAGRGEAPREVWIALGAVIVAIGLSAWIVLVLRHGAPIRLIGFVTGAGDVTIVTAAIIAIALAGRAEVALNSQVTWAVYLLGIVATALRFDIRICLFVGACAAVQYAAVVAWITSVWSIPIGSYAGDEPGTTSLLIQVARLMLMIAACAVAAGIVNRSRYLVLASGTDRLTGLGNRAYFEERFAAELARGRRSREPFVLVLFDLDHFKRFNDRFGHDAGDGALKAVARVMTEQSRKEDVLARWGGEEIALVLPDTDLEGARGKAERIRERLDGETLDIGSQRASITVSAGVAAYPDDGEDLETLFAAADRRLLTAKRTGRDRIVYEDSDR